MSALVGPWLVGLSVIYATSSASHPAEVFAGVIALVVVVADAFVVVKRSHRVAGAALAALLALGLFLATYRSAPLPRPGLLAGDLPSASPPGDVALVQLPTGVIHRTAAFGYRGGSLFDERDFAMTAVLVRHPRGDLLIDTGLGREIESQLQLMPFVFRAVSKLERGRSASEQLDAAGYDRKRLRGILLTHAHWDHVSGVQDFADVPVLVTAEERRFTQAGGWITAFAKSIPPVRYEEYGFEAGPYLGFDRSHDVYGDGSIVVVPAPGHTPGSVIVFVTLPSGSRYAFVGDLAWQREGISEREERPWLLRRLADSDAGEVREGLLRMAAIAERFPAIALVPAHDARGFAGLPLLGASAPPPRVPAGSRTSRPARS